MSDTLRIYDCTCKSDYAEVFGLQAPGSDRLTLDSGADAERLVACWNACRLIPTEDLQRFVFKHDQYEGWQLYIDQSLDSPGQT